MIRRYFALSLLLLVACGGGGEKKQSLYQLTREPVSVRGWILDVKGAAKGETPEIELGRRAQLFQSASVWVENTEFASGGIAENGAFVVLDVVPPDSIIGFNAPGAENARVVLQNIPGNADVLIPDLILEPGGAKVLDPKKIQVRISARVDKPTPTGKTAIVAGYTIPIMQTPVSEMVDRREYPDPGGFRPVATFK